MLPVVMVNGQALDPQPVPAIVAGFTMLPVRALATTLGATVQYDAASRTVTVVRGTHRAVLVLGSTTIELDDAYRAIPVAPQIIDGRAYAPLRSVADALGVAISYDPGANTIEIEGHLATSTSSTAGDLAPVRAGPRPGASPTATPPGKRFPL